MGDLISRAKAIAMHKAECSGDCGCCKYITKDLECGILLNVPAVDAVEVVRCKDCAYRKNPQKCLMCNGMAYKNPVGGYTWLACDQTTDEGFCQHGTKMEAKDIDVRAEKEAKKSGDDQ